MNNYQPRCFIETINPTPSIFLNNNLMPKIKNTFTTRIVMAKIY